MLLEIRHVHLHAAAVQHPLHERPQIFRQLLERFGIVADDGPRLFAALDGDVGWLAILFLMLTETPFGTLAAPCWPPTITPGPKLRNCIGN